MPWPTHPDQPQPVSTHPGPAGPRRSPAAAVLLSALLGLNLYALAQLPGWPLVLTALAVVVLVLVVEQLRAWTAGQRAQAPRHHRARAPRAAHRRDPRAAVTVATPWVTA